MSPEDLEKMEQWAKSLTREQAKDLLQKAGILDRNGDLIWPYRPDDPFPVCADQKPVIDQYLADEDIKKS